MGLFKVPKRNNISTQKILDLVENEEVSKPKITLRGTSLSAKIQAIGEKMQADLGELAGDYLLLDTREKWLEYCSCVVDNGIVAIDTETAGLSFNDIKNIAGICIYTPSNKPAYAPIGHISTITEQLLGRQITKQDVTDGIKLLKDNKVKTIFHNAYFDLLVIKLCTDIWMDIYWDTLPASFLLNENESHSLKYQYDKYVMHGEVGVHKFNDIIGTEIPMNYIPPNIAGVYSSFDPIMTFKLYEFQKPYLTKGTDECTRYKLEGVADIFFTEELPIIPVLAEMKYRGVKIDLDIAEKLRVKYTKLRDKAKEEFNKSVELLKDEIIYRMNNNHDIEYPINYNSPAQIKILIYDILKSGVIFKKEPEGTGKHVLDTVLADKKYRGTKLYDIVKALVEVKKYDKALNTFIEKIIGLAKENGGVVRPNFNSVSARTGRLSSSGECNIQQIPSKLGDIRNMFTADSGEVFISCDIKKQEVVVASLISGDSKLQEALKGGLDVYSKIASVAFDNAYEDNLEFFPDGTTNKEGKARRASAKAVTLGLLYSKGIKSISEDLHITIEKAQEVYDAVLKAFPQLANWIKSAQEKAQELGYIDGMFGRRRRLPDIKLPPYEFEFKMELDNKSKEYYTNLYTKKLDSIFKQEDKQKVINDAKYKGIIIKQNGGFIAKASREIINSSVQGSSADICKRIIIEIANNRRLAELGCKLQMSIHDEQIVSCPKENAYEVSRLLADITAKSTGDTPVKLEVDIAVSEKWYGPEYKFDENNKLVKKGN